MDFITDSLDCTNHAKRVTLMKKDLALARRIRGNEKLTNIRLFWIFIFIMLFLLNDFYNKLKNL